MKLSEQALAIVNSGYRWSAEDHRNAVARTTACSCGQHQEALDGDRTYGLGYVPDRFPCLFTAWFKAHPAQIPWGGQRQVVEWAKIHKPDELDRVIAIGETVVG